MYSISRKLTSTIKSISPEPIFYLLLSAYHKKNIVSVKRIFEAAQEEPRWLGWKELVSLNQQYSLLTNMPRTPSTNVSQMKQEAEDILSLPFIKKGNVKTFLEQGCGSGLTSYFLQCAGKEAIGIDISTTSFDKSLLEKGTKLLQADAANLCFKDECFDFVFSFASLEHFAMPELAFKEAMRVVKKGGYIYIKAGPLYLSPFGTHLYDLIKIPYCHLLFPGELLQKFVYEKIGPYDIDAINRFNYWPLENYRNLFGRYLDRLEKIFYDEWYDVSAVDLISQYSSCFRSKTKKFHDLLVSSICAIFRKIK